MNNSVKGKILTVVVTFLMTLAAAYLVIYLCGYSISTRHDPEIDNSGDKYTDMADKIRYIKSQIDEYCVMDFDEDLAIENAIYWYVASIDDLYCCYYDVESYKELQEENAGNYSGIGAIVTSKVSVLEDGLHIYRVIDNSPAMAAGLQNGDVIIQVDGTPVAGMAYQDAVDCVLGETGTNVHLTVDRNGEILEFDIIRSKFEQQYVKTKILGNIGYIEIFEFSGNAYMQFYEALLSMVNADVEGIVFDVRENPGGELYTVCNMINLLVPKDEIVVIQYKDDEDVIYSTDDIIWDKPCVVLINESSASGSELFSSALRDIRGIPLVGKKSFGKGIGQTTMGLGDGSAIKFTTFYYMTKTRHNYHGIGLEPDFDVDPGDKSGPLYYSVPDENDPQLQKAIQILKEQLENN